MEMLEVLMRMMDMEVDKVADMMVETEVDKVTEMVVKIPAIDKLSETIHIQENGSTCALFFFCKILNSKFLNGLRHSAMCQVILTNLPSTSSFITKEGGPRPFS